MARPRYQDGSLFVRGKRNKNWVARWREDVIREDGTLHRTQRTVVLGSIADLSRREARSLLQKRVSEINQGRHRVRPVTTLEKFTREQWQAGALLALKPSSARYYQFQLDKHVLPSLGGYRLCDISRSAVQQFLLDRKRKGYSGSTVHGIRTTLARVLQAAVEHGYLETNPARAIKIGGRDRKRERTFLSLPQTRLLIASLTEPCRIVVLVAVLTGMRIGEILALRWKRLDFARGTIEVAETCSDGQFGTPKTRSSHRVIPMSASLRNVLESHKQRCARTEPDALAFCTLKGTALSSKNLYNRELAPTCDRLELPRVSWHTFRHTNATLLGEVGESLKTAQAILGHSDLQTTLNTYMHVVPDSQRRAVERVAGVLFPDVPSSGSDPNEATRIN
ncbi:MAG TPA: site-specific integrase [Candidatus Acidoferrum sp.]|nr:site-specific integrase [Candidatus Acidoferrum sp.]